MRRHNVIKLLGGTVAGRPLVVRAKQAMRMRRIGVIMSFLESDPRSKIGTSAFEQDLQERGWPLGGNLPIEYRWANYGDLYLPNTIVEQMQ